MSLRCARGDHLLLLPEDVPGLKKPVYAKVTRVTGASATVIDVDNSKREWKVPTDVVVARHVNEAVATGPQPGLWLRQGVVVQLEDARVYGQVVRVADGQLIVRHGTGKEVRVRIPDAIQVDPIIALLLWDHHASSAEAADTMAGRHSTILDRLLGSPTQRRPRPSRDTGVLLHNLVPVADIPDGSIARSWIDPHDGSERVFPLQHAIDYVHVTDSVARRVPKSVRDSVGELFCRPPVTARSPAVAAASVPTRRPHAKRSLPSEDSFFNSSSPASSDADPDLNARIMGKLTDDPVLLAHFLQVVAPTDTQPAASTAAEPAIRHPKRHRVNSYGSSPEKVKPSKYTFQPDRQRVRVRRLTTPPSLAGTSPVDFLDGLISHPAVQFAPHPGTLMRLFDLQFGTRGLSIMHLAWLNSIQKMEWIMSSGVNMQNFSLAVALPPAPTPRSLEEISMALSSFHSYCVAFCTDDVIAIAQELLTFVQQLLGHHIWMVDDLPHLVYWLNSRLETFRAKAVHDLNGGDTRRTVCTTISTTDPEYQAIVQQLTQRTLTRLRPNMPATPATLAPARQAPKTGSSRLMKHERRQYEQPRQTAPQSAFASIRQHIPRRDNRELCLRYLSTRGCPGAPGDSSQCDQQHRVHDIPTTLHPDLRAYIQRFGGLRADLQHL